MRGIGRLFLVLTAVLVIAAVVAACAGTTQQGTTNKQQTTTPSFDISKITQSWAGSLHQRPVTFAAQEAFCVGCHDGGAFATGVMDPKKLGRDSSPFGPWVVATDCRACHTGRGAEMIRSGTATITTTSETIHASTGAVCLGCHHELKKADPNDTTHAGPHPGSQAGVWTGTGGITTGMTLKSTKPHATMKKACVTCHETSQSWGPDHSLKVNVSKTCALSGCHDGKATGAPDLTVKADYDGNGKVEGIQTEVKGLQSIVTSATLAEAKATTMTEDKGIIKLKNGTSDVSITPKAYMGAYNVMLTQVDGSEGVHNPWYVVTLLQQTYQQLTGNPVPNAKTPSSQ